jgi:hypothetical protein
MLYHWGAKRRLNPGRWALELHALHSVRSIVRHRMEYTMTYRVFLSYPRVADRKWSVTDLQGHLQGELQEKTGDAELTVFMDKKDIEGGDTWSRVLEDELRRSDAIVILLSPLWLSREWCRRELALYREGRTTKGQQPIVIPLIWDETTLQDALDAEQKDILEFLFAMAHHDWRELKYQHSRDATYMPSVGRLANHIAKKLRGR